VTFKSRNQLQSATPRRKVTTICYCNSAAPPAAATHPLTASSASIDGYAFGTGYLFGGPARPG